MTPQPTGTCSSRNEKSKSRKTINNCSTYRGSVDLLHVSGVWSGLTQTLSGVEPCGKFLDVLRFPGLVHVAQGDVTQQQQPCVVGPAGAAVVGGLGDHVSKIDT